MSWRVARSLDTLLAEVNAAAPSRSKVADGSVGDTSHQARPSDHNPNSAGVVRARDFTHDPAGGLDAGQLAEHVRQRGITGHPALGAGAYVIWNWRIASATYGWTWRTYSGSNGHTHHCHVSVSTAASGYDSTAPWGWKESDDMAQYEDQLDRIEAQGKALLAGQDKALRQNAKIREKVARLHKKGTATREDIAELAASLEED